MIVRLGSLDRLPSLNLRNPFRKMILLFLWRGLHSAVFKEIPHRHASFPHIA